MSEHQSIFESRGEPMGKVMGTLARDLRMLMDERMKDLSLSGSRWTVLLVLDILGNPSPQKVIAQHVGIEGPSLVSVLDELEERGLVRRKQDNRDRRVKLVELLPDAEPLLEELMVIGRKLEEETFGILPDENRKRLRRDLLTVREHVQGLLGK